MSSSSQKYPLKRQITESRARPEWANVGGGVGSTNPLQNQERVVSAAVRSCAPFELVRVYVQVLE